MARLFTVLAPDACESCVENFPNGALVLPVVEALLAGLLSIGCGGNPVTPTPGPISALQITCPANQTAESLDGSGSTVEYPPSSVTGGAEPVTLTCTPASGSSFSLGSTRVACTAVDQSQRTAACSFNVIVESAGAPPQLTCPMGQTVRSLDGGDVLVDYPAPEIVGGSAPVALTCTPASGSPLAVGSTSVSCTAVDRHHRESQCSFAVTVVPPKLEVTKILAFGDSITYGTLEPPCRRSTLGGPLTSYELDVLTPFATPGLSTAYPSVLQTLLAKRYKAQSIEVINEGLGGEHVTHSGTMSRFRSALDQHDPEVLLLQEGVNDLQGENPEIPVDVVASTIGRMIRVARDRRVSVFLGTLLPEREGSCRAGAPERIEPANERIRAIGVREGAELVDLYEAFLGQEAALLGGDGLHPSVAGYEKMAEIFFDAIRTRFEVPESKVTTAIDRRTSDLRP
jgi:lysophospholipase L1-like esterase